VLITQEKWKHIKTEEVGKVTVDPDALAEKELDYDDLTRLWLEALNGCAKENSTILKKHPWAASKWDEIQKEIEETPDGVVIDIPAEPTERSAELQSVYSVGPEDQAHVDIPMEVDEINVSKANKEETPPSKRASSPRKSKRPTKRS